MAPSPGSGSSSGSATRAREREALASRELVTRMLRRPTRFDETSPATRPGRPNWDSLRTDRSNVTTTERVGSHRPYPSLSLFREHSRSPPQSSTSLSSLPSTSTSPLSSLWPGIRSEARYLDLLQSHRFTMGASESRNRWDG